MNVIHGDILTLLYILALAGQSRQALQCPQLTEFSSNITKDLGSNFKCNHKNCFTIECAGIATLGDLPLGDITLSASIYYCRKEIAIIVNKNNTQIANISLQNNVPVNKVLKGSKITIKSDILVEKGKLKIKIITEIKGKNKWGGAKDNTIPLYGLLTDMCSQNTSLSTKNLTETRPVTSPNSTMIKVNETVIRTTISSSKTATTPTNTPTTEDKGSTVSVVNNQSTIEPVTTTEPSTKMVLTITKSSKTAVTTKKSTELVSTVTPKKSTKIVVSTVMPEKSTKAVVSTVPTTEVTQAVVSTLITKKSTKGATGAPTIKKPTRKTTRVPTTKISSMKPSSKSTIVTKQTTVESSTKTSRPIMKGHSKTTKTILFVLAIVILLAVIGLVIYCKKKKRLSNLPAYYNDIVINDPLKLDEDDVDESEMDDNNDDDELPLFT